MLHIRKIYDINLMVFFKAEKKQETWTGRDSLFIAPAMEQIAPDCGFTPSLYWIGEAWDNVSGGSKTGSVYDSLFTLGLEQDLSKSEEGPE